MGGGGAPPIGQDVLDFGVDWWAKRKGIAACGAGVCGVAAGLCDADVNADGGIDGGGVEVFFASLDQGGC